MALRRAMPERTLNEYTAQAADYERRWRHYLAVTHAHTLAALAPRSGGRILDAGCGTGLFLARIASLHPNARLTGMDTSGAMLARARRRLPDGVDLTRADLNCLPFADAAFDTVVTTSALHHLADPKAAFLEAARVLAPGGRLIVTDWNGDALSMRAFSRLHQRRRHIPLHVYRAVELERALSAAGLGAATIVRFRALPLWSLFTLTATRPAFVQDNP